MGPQSAKEPASAQRHPFLGSVRFATGAAVRQGQAARWRRAPKTHSLLITLFTSFSGAINREKRSRDFINQGKKCITVAQEKRQFGYGTSLMLGPNSKIFGQKLTKVQLREY